MLRHSTGYKLANDGHDTRPPRLRPQLRAARALISAPPAAAIEADAHETAVLR